MSSYNEEYFEKTKIPIPSWADGKTKDYTRFGALLPTRDGRKTGNSVVARVTVTENGVRIYAVTEAGNIVGPLTLSEVEELYYPPTYYSPFRNFPGKSGEAWNNFILEEQSQAKAAMDYDPAPDVNFGFSDGNASEIHVVGIDGKPHWMPLIEVLEYIQENTPPITTNNKYGEKMDISELIIGKGPVDKGDHITEYPKETLKDTPSSVYIPLDVYWDMSDGFFKSQINSVIQSSTFHRQWEKHKTAFPTKPYAK